MNLLHISPGDSSLLSGNTLFILIAQANMDPA